MVMVDEAEKAVAGHERRARIDKERVLDESETGAIRRDHAVATLAVTPPAIGEELGLQPGRNRLDVVEAAGAQPVGFAGDPLIEAVIGEIDDAAKTFSVLGQESAIAKPDCVPLRSDAAKGGDAGGGRIVSIGQ